MRPFEGLRRPRITAEAAFAGDERSRAPVSPWPTRRHSGCSVPSPCKLGLSNAVSGVQGLNLGSINGKVASGGLGGGILMAVMGAIKMAKAKQACVMLTNDH